jgi:hypothetical protein
MTRHTVLTVAASMALFVPRNASAQTKQYALESVEGLR